MKYLTLLFTSALVLSGCGQSAAPDPAQNSAAGTPQLSQTSATAKGFAIDDAYRKSAKEWGQMLYPAKTEEEVHQDVTTRNMHYLFVALLEMFPASAHRNEVEQFLNARFEMLELPAMRLISYEELQSTFGFNGVNDIYRWNNSFVALTPGGNVYVLDSSVNSPASAMTVGRSSIELPTPLCIGNLQVLRGTFQTKESGIEFSAGSAFLYPKPGGR
jgi:hypothetical protein